jgi:hypothetical protein
MDNQHKHYSEEMSRLAREPVKAYQLRKKDLFVFGSEKACKKLFHHVRHSSSEATIQVTSDPWYQHYLTVPDFF